MAFRLKDNARMLFAVTIVSAVSFCSVGVFASIQSLSKQFREDYLAAVVYIAKDGSGVDRSHLADIEAELAAKGLAYGVVRMPIKYAAVEASTAPSPPRLMPIVSFSDYRKTVEQAGFAFGEPPLTGDEALVMLGAQRDRRAADVRTPASYTLRANGLSVREIGHTKHVPIPDYLSDDLAGEAAGGFGGVVVADELFGRIAAEKTDRFTGYYVSDYERTFGLAAGLAPDGVVRYDSDQPYAMTVSGTLAAVQRSLYGTMLFAALLVGTVFFIAAGSMLYFRLYADLDDDGRQYAAVSKLGLTEKELNRSVTVQLATLFFAPIAFAIVHSAFAFAALQSFFPLSIAAETGGVLLGFVAAQTAYFAVIRHRYIRNLNRYLHST